MRNHTRFPALVVIALSIAGCMVGTSSATFKPANAPAGVEARLRFRRGEIRGELLEVRDSGVVVAPAGEIIYVPFAHIRLAAFEQTHLGYMGRSPRPEVRERMRLLSRFPNGLPADQLERLLAARGQQSLRVYQP
jgi:hypothetical protein